MADTIKSVSIKIGADTKDFIDSLKKIDKEIKYSENSAKELQKQLQIKYDEKKWSKAQKIVKDDLDATAEKAKKIKEELAFLEKQGFVDTDGYKKIQNELEKTETQAEKLNAELEKLDKIKLDGAYQGIKNISKGLETAAKKTAVLSAGAAAAIAGIVKSGSDAATTGAELQDMADRLGVSAEALQKYDYIALQSGVETEQLVKSIAKARDAIGTGLAGGTSTAVTALQTLFGDLSKIPSGTEEGFTAIIEQLSKVEDSTLQAYYANEIFGERLATNLIPLINNGADKLDKLGQEFESIGYLSNEQVQALADFDDELNIMKERLELAKTELGIAMLPLMEQFANILTEYIVPAIKSFTGWFNNLNDTTKNFIPVLLLLVASLSPVLAIASKIVGLLPSLKIMLDTLSTHPIIAAIGVVAGLLLYLYSTNEKFAKSVNKLLNMLGESLSSILKPAVNVLSGVLGMLNPMIDLLVNMLCPALELVFTFLQPIVWLMEKINDLVNGVGNFILGIFGKGWLWGFENSDNSEESASKPFNENDFNFTLPSTSNSVSNENYSNDIYNLDITLNTTGNLEYDINELADAVIKKMVVAKQSSGR